MDPTGNLVSDIICRTAELGLTVTDAVDAGTLTVINADPVDVADTCPDCGDLAVKRDFIRRRLVDLPIVGFRTCLHAPVLRFSCTNPTFASRIFRTLLTCAPTTERDSPTG